jgi:hypothetical protein
MSLLPDAVEHWPTPTVQEAGKIGNQANHGQLALSNHPAIRGEVSREKYEKGKHGQAAPASSSSLGSRQGLWATPTNCDHKGATTPEACKQWESRGQNLPEMVVGNWATPQAKDHKSGHRDPTIVQYKQLNVEVEARATGKLNPRWVETLMGLPIGWTMPSCVSPQTIAPMSCDSSAMELSQPPQSGLSGFSLAS